MSLLQEWDMFLLVGHHQTLCLLREILTLATMMIITKIIMEVDMNQRKSRSGRFLRHSKITRPLPLTGKGIIRAEFGKIGVEWG